MYSHLKFIFCAIALFALPGGVQPPRPPAPAPASAVERAYRANNVGVAWLERFDYARASAAFREALALHPSLGIARFNLALALLYDNKLDEADAEARAAAAAMRGSPAPDYAAGLIAKAQGRGAAAVQAFARAVQADPQDAAAHTLLGQMRMQQGDAAGAAASLQAALELEPYSATAAYNLSIALSRGGRAEEGRRMLLRFQALREHGGTTLGAGYLEQGRYAQGIVSTGAEPDLVDPAVPAVRFVAGPPGAPARTSSDAAITLCDADGDGDLDAIEAAADGLRLWRNTGGRLVSAGVKTSPAGEAHAAGATIVVAGDYNNDGRDDVLVAGQNRVALYRNRGAGALVNVTASSHLRALANDPPLAAAFVDIDHDGDLDSLVAGGVWRNNGDGTFSDVTAASGIVTARATAIVPTDYDERRDVDLLIASDNGRLALFRNLRDGTFRDVAREAGLSASGRLGGIAAGDLNRDGRADFLITRSDGAATFAMSAAYAKYRVDAAPAGAAGAASAQTLDYDNDGLTDLLVVVNQRLRLLRSLGTSWHDVTAAAFGAAAEDIVLPALAPGRALAIGDVDGDGDDDLVVRASRGLQVLRNEGGHRRGALRVRLAARVSNRSGTGSRIEMRAGSLHVRRETYAATPAPAPADLLLGLGGRTAVDAVRVQWPAGIVQAELQPAPGRALTITELDRKPSSCPYLFAWNGSRFEFVTDFLGGGELGYWLAPGVRSEPDPDEYVRLPPGVLRERNGSYELRISNELEEVLYLDHLHLESVAHPAGAEVYPNEGLLSPPYPAHALFVVRDVRPVAAAFDDRGRDVAPSLASVDRTSPPFPLIDIRGYAEPHALTVRLGAGANDALLLTGWTDYAFSSDNVAASQRGLQLAPPSLQVRDTDGHWRTVIEDIGIPVGRPQTMVVDLRRPSLRDHREFRIVTNMRIYWDRVAAASLDDRAQPAVTRLYPSSAELRWRGFSAEVSSDGLEPFGYDYGTVSAFSPWKTMPGTYSREGDVREPLASTDDRFVVMRPGDEVALAFDAAHVPPDRPGWTRTFLLYGDGFSKEMDVNSASPDHVQPLPSHSMRTYPPPRATAADRGRRVAAPVQSIDSLVLDAQRGKSSARRSPSR